jgi:hypothetical protein
MQVPKILKPQVSIPPRLQASSKAFLMLLTGLPGRVKTRPSVFGIFRCSALNSSRGPEMPVK